MEQGFYVRRGIAEALKLSDTERDVYSVIYSFTKNKEAGAYVGRQSYLAELTSRSISAVSKALISLIAKGFVTKICYTDHKERRTAYSADLELAARLIKQHVDEVNRAQADEQSGENPPKLGIRGENDQAAAAQRSEADKRTESYAPSGSVVQRREFSDKHSGSYAASGSATQRSEFSDKHSGSYAAIGSAAQRSETYDKRNESYAASGSAAQRSEFSDKRSGSFAASGSAAQRSEFSDKHSGSYATYRPRASSTRVDPDYANEAMRLALERSYGE